MARTSAHRSRAAIRLCPMQMPRRCAQLLYGPDSPCFVPDESIADQRDVLPATVVIEELWKLQGEVDRWLIQIRPKRPRTP